MARRKVKAGITSVQEPIFVQNTSSTTGAGLSGLTFSTASLVAEYRGELDSAWTSISLVTKTLGTYVSGGFIVDGGLAGAYAFDPPNACFASARGRWVNVRLYGATNMFPVELGYELDAIDYQDGVRAGLTSLPPVPSGSAGAIPTTGTGANQISVSSGQVTAASVVGDVAGKVLGGGSGTITGVGVQTNDDALMLSGTVNDVSPTASSFTCSSGLSATANFYFRNYLVFTTGTLAGLAREITGWTTGRVASFTIAFPSAPANGDAFRILGYGGPVS